MENCLVDMKSFSWTEVPEMHYLRIHVRGEEYVPRCLTSYSGPLLCGREDCCEICAIDETVGAEETFVIDT
jgi:hypothetical protein